MTARPTPVNPVHTALPRLCEGVAVALMFAVAVIGLAMWVAV